jgi:hypothetical protein
MNARIMTFGVRIAVLTALLLALGGLTAKNDQSEHPLDAVYRKAAGSAVQRGESALILRRMSLHLRGTIPGIKEIEAFEAADPESRDANFAVEFLRSPEFANYWGTWMESLLRGPTAGWKNPHGAFYRYLAASLHENKPYDALVREMLVSNGSAEKSPAAYFYLRDGADALQTAEYVGRLFYAKRVACARCHDHPFEKDFTRRDYYGLAAFFSQQFARSDSWDPNHLGGTAVPWEVRDNLPDADRKTLDQAWNEWNQENWNKWSEAERQAYRKKHELQYATLFYQSKLGLRFPRTDDEPGGDLVKPRFLDGTTPRIREGEDRRAVFAAWLTDKKNDRFRKVFINRVWTRLMGWSFFTPLDDWNADTKMQGAEILNHLDAVFVQRQGRIKDLVLYIVTSDAYQRAAPPAQSKESLVYFPAERMDADQLLNSLIRASQMQTVGDIWEQRRFIPVDDSGISNIDLRGTGPLKFPLSPQKDFSSAAEVNRPADYNTFLAIFGAGPRRDIEDDEKEISIEQVLTLMNGRLTGRIVWDYAQNKNSYIYQEYQKSKDLASVFELMYLTTLSRRMTAEEKAGLMKLTRNRYVTQMDDAQNAAAMNDLMWALLNSQEFIHVR